MDKIKISRIPAKELRTQEFPEFAQEVCTIIEKYQPSELKIDRVFALLQAVMPEVAKITLRESSHPLTAELLTLRKERDKALTGLLYLIRGIKATLIEPYASAAKIAIPVLDKFLSDINKQNNLVKRRNLQLLTVQIEDDSELLAAIQTLGLKVSLDELKRLNNSIGVLQVSRRETRSQAERVVNNAIISNASSAMSNLFKSIEINQLAEKDVDYVPLIRELNELMAEYNNILSVRSQSPKSEDIKKTDTVPSKTTVSA